MRLPLLLLLLAAATSLQAQKLKPQQVIENLDQNTERYWEIAHEIWTLAELGYQEHKSSALLQQELKSAGFSVEAGVAGAAETSDERHDRAHPPAVEGKLEPAVGFTRRHLHLE